MFKQASAFILTKAALYTEDAASCCPEAWPKKLFFDCKEAGNEYPTILSNSSATSQSIIVRIEQ
jgi:hypothetical protein